MRYSADHLGRIAERASTYRAVKNGDLLPDSQGPDPAARPGEHDAAEDAPRNVPADECFQLLHHCCCVTGKYDMSPLDFRFIVGSVVFHGPSLA